MTTDDRAELEQRLHRLEERVGLLQDHLDITRLIYSYGPAVDTCAADVVSDIWTADGVYDVDTGRMDGRDAIRRMVSSETHQGYVHGGCGHVTGPAHVTVSGDRAVATLYSQLITQNPTRDGFRVSRLSANRWELRRTDAGWRVTSRTNRLLDAEGTGREVLAAGVAAASQIATS
ncbi:nuclear transport factor 2 family protein [Rhodococcus sp. D2-41]|uniref:Nuclear transport factor 2 family protein n=1 Tax=Speluncibacter jeojiensis TaxID=2710754 RepID=A0A9X4M1D9_9ACTN|nr:nuclear transport factor 2 family protein [Rhodococcus sp. D2-41]MDG3011631.1 nuclear transport factor 2 family protein [Rhodococcus sp. D2-41]MDG3015014.1 nuclear transport factor 2 family protein [Corynebacteriales bacterium D3-21]